VGGAEKPSPPQARVTCIRWEPAASAQASASSAICATNPTTPRRMRWWLRATARATHGTCTCSACRSGTRPPSTGCRRRLSAPQATARLPAKYVALPTRQPSNVLTDARLPCWRCVVVVAVVVVVVGLCLLCFSDDFILCVFFSFFSSFIVERESWSLSCFGSSDEARHEPFPVQHQVSS
jgi:hypothetical protein